ncbi:MAG TPA: DciA family protein [Roseiarcus sp.]|nr:DciA family protein [Roseiarcus sp.]
MPLPRRGAKALAEFVPKILEEALATRGVSEASLIADWPAIVGESVARYARPIELQWRPRPARRDPETAIAPATLVLRVEGAFALEAQHNAAIIAARVNAHLGWRCVDKIAFRQGPLPPPKEKRRPPPAPSAEAEAEARAAAAAIGDGDLREALTRLGARAIERSARRVADWPRGGE